MGDLLQVADKVGAAHYALAGQVQGTLIDKLKGTAREHDRMRRETLNEVRTSRAAWKKQMTAFEKIRKTKDAAIKAAEDARIAFERANQDKNVTKAYVERLRDEYATKARRTLVTKEEYIQAAQSIRTVQRAFYDVELPQLFDRLHQIEEARLTRIKDHLREFAELLASMATDEAAYYNGLLGKWGSLAPALILQQFIDELRTDGPFTYPEEVIIDECASTECLGVVSTTASPPGRPPISEVPKLSRQASRLLLCQDTEVIRARLIELEREIPTMERKHEGVKNLHQLYQDQPELADETTRGEAERQMYELASELASLRLEKSQLEEKVEGEGVNGTKSSTSIISKTTPSSTPSSPVLWEDPSTDHFHIPVEDSPPKEPSMAGQIPTAQSPQLTSIEPHREGKETAALARVLFDFEALDEAYEVSVCQGQDVIVISKDGEWCQVELDDGRVGYVPLNYIQEGLL